MAERDMKGTVELDEQLLAKACELAGLTDPGSLIQEALTALVQRETARRLARLGGTQPDLKAVPRRRQPPEK